MYQPNKFQTTILRTRNQLAIRLYGGFLLIPITLACFGLSPAPNAFAVTPAPDGGYPGENTAEGDSALLSLTTGSEDTAIGFDALWVNKSGSYNTATGSEALFSNIAGHDNTANGVQALFSNTGSYNTATGVDALANNTTGHNNAATGWYALFRNTTGHDNTANGYQALSGGPVFTPPATGNDNTADGSNALFNNTTGNDNTGSGYNALYSNTTGSHNTASGYEALYKTLGSHNVGVGFQAGFNLTTGSNNIDIGAVGNSGDTNTIRIGKGGVQTKAFMQGISGASVTGSAVQVSSSGQLGVATSSARFKDEIKPMDSASEAILALKPVTFRYKQEIDPEGTRQFGLVAEEVEKVNPGLVTRDAQGKVFTVRYEAVNAMLLNEFLKEHREVQEQKATIAKQQKQIEALAAGLQKVSDQLELSKPAPRTVNNP
jgi:trimeric autotransporter adhesin